MTSPPTIAIVDDDAGVRDSLTVLLSAAGYRTREYGSAEAFLREPLEGNPGCAIIDLRLPGIDGLALQAEMGRRGLQMPVILVTAHGDVASARQALRTGAVDFLEKPIDNEELLNAVRKPSKAATVRSSSVRRMRAQRCCSGRSRNASARSTIASSAACTTARSPSTSASARAPSKCIAHA